MYKYQNIQWKTRKTKTNNKKNIYKAYLKENTKPI